MFRHTAQFYDAIYSFKDYRKEAGKVRRIILRHARRDVENLLDVACGTGLHLQQLQRHFRVEGLDADPAMLRVARKRLPDVRFHRADMRHFRLGKKYDAVVCLFSSIGYARHVEGLRSALKAMARHTRPGGVVLVEPWIYPSRWTDGHMGALTVERPDLVISRVDVSSRRGHDSKLTFHYLIAHEKRIRHEVEIHRLGLFTDAQYRDAFRRADLQVRRDTKGLIGRGLYIGYKPRA